ncbi:MAG: hypothetical protein F7B59_04835 [Desulfurococcales archaeon]|nr:hypothetical protein [Desulfurococcales archaeon]
MPWLLEAYYKRRDRNKRYYRECHETYESAVESRARHWRWKTCKRVVLTLVDNCDGNGSQGK